MYSGKSGVVMSIKKYRNDSTGDSREGLNFPTLHSCIAAKLVRLSALLKQQWIFVPPGCVDGGPCALYDNGIAGGKYKDDFPFTPLRFVC